MSTMPDKLTPKAFEALLAKAVAPYNLTPSGAAPDDGEFGNAPYTALLVLYEFEMLDFSKCDEGTPWDGRTDVLFLEQLTVCGARRRGHGRRLMQAACALADQHGQILVLNPWAQPGKGDGTLPQEHLERWYQNQGFVWGDDHLMFRTPVGLSALNGVT